MGGIFGVISKEDCVQDLFYGTDYHSHLGTRRGGMAVTDNGQFKRIIHNIENDQFRSKFEGDLPRLTGKLGIGCISDTEDQPLIIGSHLGTFGVVTVGRINNLMELATGAFKERRGHFSEMSDGEINASELLATMISREDTFGQGIRNAQNSVDGSCTLLVAAKEGLYAARDRFGRTPLIIGKRDNTFCATMETCAFPNLGYTQQYELGPGEIVLITPDGYEQIMPPHDSMKICAFLWVYYGYPASSYEGMNVEVMRNRSGQALAKRDSVQVDMVAGIPDSGTAHAIGYANEARVPYTRPFVKYTPTWPRSFMPQNQDIRDLVARMKLIPISEIIKDKKLLFCEDSIVRGTQLRETIIRLFSSGAKEVHMRPACPPLIYGCRFLNFSRSRSEMDLAGRQSIKKLEGDGQINLKDYADPGSDKYHAMVDGIRSMLGLSTLQYQQLPDMVRAIGLPKEKLCTYCWDGEG